MIASAPITDNVKAIILINMVSNKNIILNKVSNQSLMFIEK